MESSIYHGTVIHHRHYPIDHRFSYAVYSLLLDIDQLESLLNALPLTSYERFNFASFYRRDHFASSNLTLREALSNKIVSAGGEVPKGPIFLLTQLRYLGYGFNPVSFYYCFDEAGQELATVVAEVTNTPWREQHHYVLMSKTRIHQLGTKQCHQFDKKLHVSPFMTLDHHYLLTTDYSTTKLIVSMQNWVDGQRYFDASLVLERKALTRKNYQAMLLRHPFIAWQIVARIYWQALKLWLKRVPVQSHS